MTQSDPCIAPLWTNRQGAGGPVLLLHGLGGSAHYWDDVLSLIRGGEVTVPDLLGFGRSPAPGDASYDVSCHLRALRPLLGAGTVVVGHSTGGMVAAALAAAHPECVRGLVLVGVPVFANSSEARVGIGRIGLLARLTVEERPMGRLLCQAMCRFRPLAVAAAPWLLRGMPRAVAADAARHTWPSYSRTLRTVVVEHRLEPDLERITAPVVFLHGRSDRTAPVTAVEALAERRSVAGRPVTLELVDGDHHLPVRRPDVVAAAVNRL